MKEEVVKKYVRDLDGLLREINEWERTGQTLDDVYGHEAMYHDALVFLFGRLYRFFNFEDIIFGSPKGLDAMVTYKGERIEIEFQVYSREFKREHPKEVESSEKIIIVCWENNWENPPSNIDVIELRQFFKE